MATTVTNASLTVTVTEAITLNGQDYGATNSKVTASINEIAKGIVTVNTDKNEILGFIASGAAKGSFIEANVRYIRITNLDDTNFVVLFFTNESSDEFGVKLDAGQSFIFNADNVGGVVDTFDANSGCAASSGQLADLTAISSQADTASVDLEYFVACA